MYNDMHDGDSSIDIDLAPTYHYDYVSYLLMLLVPELLY